MKKIKTNGESSRSPLMIGATVLTTSILLGLMLFAAHLRMDTSTKASEERNDVLCTTTSMITTTTQSTTSSTTTSTTTTTTTATTTLTTTTSTTTQTSAQENIQAIDPEPEYVEPEEEYVEEYVEIQEAPPASDSSSGLPITDYERTLLRNVVAREYGSDWVPIEEKAKVVAVVINRVNSPSYPNTIEGVLTQPYQFSGYYACSYEWSNVTPSVRDAVDYYFAHSGEFGSWTGFWGDGTYNHFY